MEKSEPRYDVDAAVAAQREYCKEHNVPNFAGSGRCWRCGRNVYSEGGWSVERASTQLITGCPHCFVSFVD